MPELISDRAGWSNRDRAVRSGLNVAPNGRGARAQRIGKTESGADIPASLRFQGIVRSVRAEVRIGGIKTVGAQIVAVQVDVYGGCEGESENGRGNCRAVALMVVSCADHD